MGLPTSEPEKSGQWTIEERRDPRNGVQPHYAYSHHGLSVSDVASRDKIWTPERASWATWLLSSFAMSLAFTFLLNGRPLDQLSGYGQQPQGRPKAFLENATTKTPSYAPLERRATCQSGGSDAASYNLPLRVGALFIILAVSSAACAFPILVTRLPGLRIPDNFFFAVRHFGTGVLIATAFVHLLPTAFTLLGDPCLGKFWTQDFEAMPGAIALVGIFVVTVIEMLLHPARRTAIPDGEDEQKKKKPATTAAASSEVRAKRPVVGRSESIGRTLSNITSRPSGDAIRASTRREEGATSNKETTEDMEDAEAGLPEGPPVLSEHQKHRKDIMQIVLLEMGILFHSVFIGMALSVSIGGNEFVVLLIAIAFHQTFEGLALGARIAAIEWPEKSLQPIFMAVAYGCTTPIGQAIGLASRSAYSPESEVGLILVGVMNAISAGLLTFASLVELLSEDLLSDESWRILRGRRRVCAFVLVVAGAFLMSLVGAWA
ncbi:ZIP zinc transporter-domain-containing protein [Apiospora rasikravindrae]|uniref:ZIP zinc transporter-domain-containing protein n=1 Tax=Apiospora rasikravindrae TaxID=990691 RepID=A0ABR1TIE9_9PEZI